MKALHLEPKIIALANALKLKGDPVVAILKFCRKRVAKVLKQSRSVHTIWDLERVLCTSLNLVIHEVWNDEEVANFADHYAKNEGEGVFAALAWELRGDSYGVLIQRKALTRDGEYQYVAFVDCRGQKSQRRFFTRWHEIAHCLTSYEQFEMSFRRNVPLEIQKDPIETMMDMIAGELGFFDPLFRPVLDSAIGTGSFLTFDLAENIRSQFCPDASFQATLNASASRVYVPTIVLELAMGLKKEERRALLSSVKAQKPVAKLRVITSVPNEAARKISLRIPRGMRAPEESILSRVFSSNVDSIPGEAFENLAWWTSSDGARLANAEVLIQARKSNNRLFAIVSLIVKPKKSRSNKRRAVLQEEASSVTAA